MPRNGEMAAGWTANRHKSNPTSKNGKDLPAQVSKFLVDSLKSHGVWYVK